MEVGLYVEIAGEPVLSRKVATVQKGLEDFTPLWNEVASWFYEMEAKQFASEGRSSWKPLAESTMYQRLRKGYGGAHPILERTGKLAASLLGAEKHVREETPESIKLGTAVEYAIFHQRGTSRMPARPIIGRETQAGQPVLYAEDATSLRRLFADYVHKLATA